MPLAHTLGIPLRQLIGPVVGRLQPARPCLRTVRAFSWERVMNALDFEHDPQAWQPKAAPAPVQAPPTPNLPAVVVQVQSAARQPD